MAVAWGALHAAFGAAHLGAIDAGMGRQVFLQDRTFLACGTDGCAQCCRQRVLRMPGRRHRYAPIVDA